MNRATPVNIPTPLRSTADAFQAFDIGEVGWEFFYDTQRRRHQLESSNAARARSLRPYDVLTLLPRQHLDANVIESYLQIVIDETPTAALLSSSRLEGIPDKDRIVVRQELESITRSAEVTTIYWPYCIDGHHWILVVFHLDRESKSWTAQFFDPLGRNTPHANRAVTLVVTIAEQSSKDASSFFSGWSVPQCSQLTVTGLPQDLPRYDCGVYVVRAAERFLGRPAADNCSDQRFSMATTLRDAYLPNPEPAVAHKRGLLLEQREKIKRAWFGALSTDYPAEQDRHRPMRDQDNTSEQLPEHESSEDDASDEAFDDSDIDYDMIRSDSSDDFEPAEHDIAADELAGIGFAADERAGHELASGELANDGLATALGVAIEYTFCISSRCC